MRGKVSKTEKRLLMLSAVFLCVLALLFYHESRKGEQRDGYTVTPERITQEQVAPEDLWPLDLNSATAEELATLPGVGEVLAQRIVDWRMENGAFADIKQLLEVRGIGEAIFEEIQDKITVGEAP